MKNLPRNRRIGLVLTILVVIISVLGLITAPYFFLTVEEPSMIKIEKNGDSSSVKREICSAVGEKMGDKIADLLTLVGVEWQSCYGAYEVNPGDSPLKVARRIRNHQRSAVKVTLRACRTIDDFCDFMGEKLMLSADSLRAALANEEVCARYNKTPQTIIGLFLPDTHEIYWHTSIDALLDKLAENYQSFWNSDRKAKAKSLGLSEDEVITVASICEEESNVMSDRGIIGRLYINRLRKGMLLQADPTVKFAIGDFTIKRIAGEMLHTDSPYNTYMYKGLPPGPIRMVDKRTIDAIFSAPDNDYIYMCAKEDFSGKHNFTASYAEHQANARRYQKALNERGIK